MYSRPQAHVNVCSHDAADEWKVNVITHILTHFLYLKALHPHCASLYLKSSQYVYILLLLLLFSLLFWSLSGLSSLIPLHCLLSL